MGDILDTADYDAVRNILGVGSQVVGDGVIESLNYLPIVEAEVKDAVPTWSDILSADDSDTTRLKLGVANWVAARLCAFLQRQESQDYKLADYTHRPTDVDWAQKAKDLVAEAASSLAKLTAVTAPRRMTLLKVDGPTRSRTNVPSDLESWEDRIQPDVIDWLEDEQT